MQSLRKLLNLSWREVIWLTQAAVLLPFVRLALRFASIGDLRDWGRLKVQDTSVSQMPPEAAARMVRVAAHRGFYRARCLEQSLVLRWLLRRQGVDAQIVFGARKLDAQMQAHAWVEVAGVAINEDGHQHFSPFQQPSGTVVNEGTR